MANNRTRGHNYERELASRFRGAGFPHVVTSRSESKARDDKKVDLMNKDEYKNGMMPFSIQAKLSATRIQYDKVLGEMPDDMGHNIIFNKYAPKVEGGKIFRTEGEYAICKADFMLELLELKYGLSDEQI